MKQKNIIIISPEAWGINFVSKHHYAETLSKDNHVFFVNPFRRFALNLTLKPTIEVDNINKNLKVINLSAPLPKMTSLPLFVQNKIYKKMVIEIKKVCEVAQFDIVWSFDPHRFYHLEVFDAKKSIFHIVDVHHGKFEQTAIQSAVHILYVSDYFKDKIAGHSSAHKIIHGVKTYPTDAQKNKDSIIKLGLVGNLHSENLDLELIKKIIHQFKNQIELYLIGPVDKNNLGGKADETTTSVLNEITSSNSVHLIPPMHNEELHEFLAGMDINLVTYKDFTKNIAPHKLMIYLSAGRLVLSSFLYDYKDYPSKTVLMADNHDTFIQLLKESIIQLDDLNRDAMIEQRKNFARQNEYSKKIVEISKLLALNS